MAIIRKREEKIMGYLTHMHSVKEPIQGSLPPTGEISLRDALYPRGTLWSPYNPDIFVMRKGGMAVYDKMRRDEQVKACQWIKRLSVLCSGWNVEAASDQPVDTEPSDFVNDCLIRIPGTLEERIKNILSGMDYGYSITEKVWGLINDGNFKGKIGLLALKTRKPHNWDFDTDQYGNLKPKGLWQLNGQWKYEPDKFIVYSHNREFDNWYGTSDLQAAYRSWWSKDVILKFWNMFLERFGMGIPYLHPGEGRSTIPEPAFTNLKNAIFNLQNNTAIAQQSGEAKLEILESTRRGTGEFDKAIQYYDRAISRALLMPSGLGIADESAPGSLARSQVHFDLWLWIMLDLRKTTEELINEQIIKELVDYNYQVTDYPKFKFNPVDEAEKVELAKLWLEAIKGNAVHPDSDDELHLRTILKFPERDRDELEAEIEEKKQQPSPSPFPFPLGNPPPEKQEPIQLHSHAKSWHRELTAYEKRVDFARVERSLDEIEDDVRTRLVKIFQKQRDQVLVTIEKAANNGNVNQKWVNSLSLPFGVPIQGIVKDLMRTVYETGRRDASEEISRARGRQHSYILKLPPRQTIQQLEQQAFWIKNVFQDTLLKRIQAILLNMLDSGEIPLETLMKIRQVYDPYVGDEQIVIDQRQIEPYRIETVIRTNTTKAYNRGRLVEFADPELQGFVRAMQVSAILDTRTTDICRAADGKIVMLDDPLAQRLTPPLHHQCRSILVPVTEADGQFEPSKQTELHQVLEDMPGDFGGNVD